MRVSSILTLFLLALLPLLLAGCATTIRNERGWAIALHAGAGVIDPAAPPEEAAAHAESLADALALGRSMLADGRSALDVTEAVVRLLEDDPKFNAGRGAVFTADGRNELDASIMDGATLRCGAVAGVTTVKNPISLARAVMESTGHILLARDGAEAFATHMGVERAGPPYFFTPVRWNYLLQVLTERGEPAPPPPPGVTVVGASCSPSAAPSRTGGRKSDFGTVGCVALDTDGNLAAATSTGGMTGKRWARVGDSPLIGAGNYANNATCAVSGTGTGEQFIRHGVARDVHARMAYAGATLDESAREIVLSGRVLQPDDGGVIAVSREGRIVMLFNSIGMFRAAADSRGRFQVGIWDRWEAVIPR